MFRRTTGDTANSPFGPRPHMTAGMAHPWRVVSRVRSNDVVLVYPAGPPAARPAVNQGGSVNGETLILGTLADVTTASVEHNSLSLAPREFMLARMAA
jgi:hypothetical protein